MGVVYLNNSASSYPKPEVVLDAVRDSLMSPPVSPYRDNVTDKTWNTRCHELLARYFMTSPERIILGSSATDGLNTVINGLLTRPCRVITTDLEHNSVLRPLFQLQRKGLITIDFVSCHAPGYVDPDVVARAITPDTGLIVINHVSNVTGTCQDIEALYAVATRKHIPLVVDTAQSAGTLTIDLSAMPAIAVAFTGHKSFFGPAGTGGLALGNDISLKTWKVGGTGIHSELEDMPDIMPLKYEPGTPNHPGIAGLAAGVDYIFREGLEKLNRIRLELVSHLMSELEIIDGLTLWSAPADKNPCGIVSFNLDAWDPEELGYILQQSFDIRVRTGLHCAPRIHQILGTYPQGTVRISLSPFTTHDEIDYFIGSLRTIGGQ